jgi:hypothetical protein
VRLSHPGMSELAARISQSGSYLQGSARLGGLQVMTGMPQLLDGLSRRLAAGRSLLAISALQLLLLGLADSVLSLEDGQLATAGRSPIGECRERDSNPHALSDRCF